jgi:predicted nuclease with RNAse H fold
VTGCIVLGIDLSGPGNPAATVAAGFRMDGDRLDRVFLRGDLDDDGLEACLEAEVPQTSDLVVGLDAPLSYNPGGGDRPGDRALRRRLVAAGLPAGTVMVPTLTRMVYLTLRGVVVARLLTSLRPGCRIVEVHPAGALALRGAPPEDVRDLKRSAAARRRLVAWLESRELTDLPAAEVDDHTVAACAAALAARDWSRGRPCWCEPAEPPRHPFDYAC